jgi:hypothetical protein
MRSPHLHDGRAPSRQPQPDGDGPLNRLWEDATLVVDTVNFSESAAFRVPHSDLPHGRADATVRDGNLLEIDINFTDPIAYVQPLHGVFFFKKIRPSNSRNGIATAC